MFEASSPFSLPLNTQYATIEHEPERCFFVTNRVQDIPYNSVIVVIPPRFIFHISIA